MQSKIKNLEQELAAFSRHLINREATRYVSEAYQSAHQEGGPLSTEPDRLEKKILAFARKGGWRLSVADAYVRIFLPTGVFRRKLVLALALVENSSLGSDKFNLEKHNGLFRGLVGITSWGFRYLILLSIGIAILGPRQLFGGSR